MGPGTYDTMSTASSSLKLVNLPKLKEDSSNWITYKERILNTLTSKSLARHVTGSARKAIQIEQHSDKNWYIPNGTTALTDDEIEEYEDKLDKWKQKEASVREVIYETVPQSTFLLIKNEPTAADVWKKLVSINEGKGDMIQMNTLTKMQQMRCPEGGNIRVHISRMTELYEELAGMGAPLTDVQFSTYIRASLPPSYHSLLTSINATSRITGKAILSSALIQEIYEAADDATVTKSNVEQEGNSALAAFKGKGKGKGRGGESKSKGEKYCSVCKKKGYHTKEDCWAKGGGKEGQAPEWYLKKKGEDTSARANIAADEHDIAFFLDLGAQDDDLDNVALVITSDFQSAALTAPKTSNGVILDSGASRHFTGDKSSMSNFVEIPNSPIRAADGRTFSATGRGDVQTYLPMGDGVKPTPVTIRNVYYSPQMAFTLVSVSRMDRAKFILHIEDGICEIRTPKPNSRVIGRIPESRGLYRINSTSTIPNLVHIASVASKVMSISELHRKMGHVNHDDLRKMVADGMVEGIELNIDSEPEFCSSCIQAKATRKPFPKQSEHNHSYQAYGEKIVTDLWGAAQVTSLGGHNYFVCYQDLWSHEEKAYFLRLKSETFETYKKYEAWVKVQRNSVIKILGSDRGGEFTSKEFNDHLEYAGTIRHLNVHDSSQSNGASERANRTHLELARAMLFAAGLPKYLWAEAVGHSIWIRNRAPTRAIPEAMTPHEKATGEKPDLTNLLEWGTSVWVKQLDVKKLEPRAAEGRFVGYDVESKGYRVYWPKRRSVTVERDIYFDRNEVLEPGTIQVEGGKELNPADPNPSTPPVPVAPELEPHPKREPEELKNDEKDSHTLPDHQNSEIPKSDSSPPPKLPQTTSKPIPTPSIHSEDLNDDIIDPEPHLGRGKRARKPVGYYKQLVDGKIDPRVAEMAEMMDFAGEADFEPGGVDLEASGCPGGAEDEWFGKVVEFALVGEDAMEPSSVIEALEGPKSHEWTDAIEAELSQIEKVNTWELVDLPPGANVIKCRYVFRHKRDANGNISKYKARLVAKGFTQVHGVDYLETFAPVVKLPTLRALFAVGASKGAVIQQADVKNAYLNAMLRELLFMELPPEYKRFRQLPLIKVKNRLVCRLFRALYGTKQGGHEWYQDLKGKFLLLGYTVCSADEAVFYKFSGNKYTIVAAATDDFTIIAESVESAELIKRQLNSFYELVDLGDINWLLGISIKRDLEAKTISLSQTAYIDQIVKRMGLQDAATVVTPLEPGVDLSYDSPALSPQILTPVEKSKYREAIGSLMYVALATRPDIAFPVSMLSKFMEKPHTTHWKAVQRVFKYLKGTRNFVLILGGDHIDLYGYSDADWASQMDRHSISGFVFFVGIGAISWSAKKQPIVTLSSTESEYVALTHAAKDLIWLRKLLLELSFLSNGSTILFSDNQGAIRLTKDSTFHARTKHIDIRFHFIRETVASGQLTIPYCPTDEMIADIFTKPLGRTKLHKFRSLLGLEPRQSA